MKFNFTNNLGEELSGRLEMPKSEPKAYALFAHCFTCSKDIIAPNTISKTLRDQGIAVLRFDFTGLGSSAGDFSDTNFTSNVDDLLQASKALTDQFQAPKLIIGHSLGGAAALQAAFLLENIKAVVTIGAPSDVSHVAHHFDSEKEEIESKGEANVCLSGRPFKIKKQFIDDLNNTDVLSIVGKLKKALLVMHSPLDKTVSVEHAANIFMAAKHPKSFVSLDKSDHLLMNKEDAHYAAEIIGSWVLRYINT